MKHLLIIKTGSTFPSLAARHGDFEHRITSKLNGIEVPVMTADVQRGDQLPHADLLSGAIITGSHAMVTDREPWSEKTALWLADASHQGLPLLGICYGHQLLAHALGGSVGYNPEGSEFGSVTVTLNRDAEKDALFKGFPHKIRVQACHKQSVLSLPKGAQLLASNSHDPHQAVAINDHAWGVQFHPEFDALFIREYIDLCRGRLLTEGKDPDALASGCSDSIWGSLILKRFASLAAARTMTERLLQPQMV